MKRLSKKQILMLHTQLIQQTGGSDGVRDYNLLDSALETPFQSFGGEDLYPTLQAKAARLGYGLIKNHCMIDAMLVFLALNDRTWIFCARSFFSNSIYDSFPSKY